MNGVVVEGERLITLQWVPKMGTNWISRYKKIVKEFCRTVDADTRGMTGRRCEVKKRFFKWFLDGRNYSTFYLYTGGNVTVESRKLMMEEREAEALLN